ncbi:hypothetical protein FIBSPDRAFT_852673 [Athelia psychrophila]|uniref:Uncharacterized protein n=1 Tax=Athelia psychrophila TaxID=1759441 RepID=A0A166RQ61_9AGAM|nr:hypothetical protein FIBSPDRAFT_852673 [Fibularhizoctonia sp. CBS 109695]
MNVHCPAATSPEAFFDQLEAPTSLYSSSSSSSSRSTLSSESDAGNIDQDEDLNVEHDGEDYTPIPRSPFITSPMRAHYGDTAGSMIPMTPKSGSSLPSFSLSRFKCKSAPSSPQTTTGWKTKPGPGAGIAIPFFRRKPPPLPPIRISTPTPILIPAHIRTRDLGAPYPLAKDRPRTNGSDSTATTAAMTVNADTSATYSTQATSAASSSGLYPIPYPSPPNSAPCTGTKSPMGISAWRVNEWVSSQMSLPLPDACSAPDTAATITMDELQTENWGGGEGVREIPVLAAMFAQHVENERARIQQIAKRGKRVLVNYAL